MLAEYSFQDFFEDNDLRKVTFYGHLLLQLFLLDLIVNIEDG
jgi:hypothetical protein